MIEPENDQPVTRARLRLELDMLRTRLETERLERETRRLWYWQYAIAFLVFITTLVIMIHTVLSRGN